MSSAQHVHDHVRAEARVALVGPDVGWRLDVRDGPGVSDGHGSLLSSPARRRYVASRRGVSQSTRRRILLQPRPGDSIAVIQLSRVSVLLVSRQVLGALPPVYVGGVVPGPADALVYGSVAGSRARRWWGA